MRLRPQSVRRELRTLRVRGLRRSFAPALPAKFAGLAQLAGTACFGYDAALQLHVRRRRSWSWPLSVRRRLPRVLVRRVLPEPAARGHAPAPAAAATSAAAAQDL